MLAVCDVVCNNLETYYKAQQVTFEAKNMFVFYIYDIA